jgi:hypothetical protein
MLNPAVGRAVRGISRWLTDLYALDLDIDATRFVMEPECARALLPEGGPRTGVLALEAEGELHLGLYVDERDSRDLGTLVEETSHLVCLAWHAARERQVSRLLLELQGDIDRFLYRHLARFSVRGPREISAASDQTGVGETHAETFRWADWLEAEDLERYRAADGRARRYCGALARAFPRRRDTPALLQELRSFYRAAPETRLRCATKSVAAS